MKQWIIRSTAGWTEADLARALQVWEEYQKQHDVSDRKGQTIGIDPSSGRVWFGDRMTDVTEAARADGVTTPLICLRVGHDYYQRKGSRR
jgi:hypothetical protein